MRVTSGCERPVKEKVQHKHKQDPEEKNWYRTILTEFFTGEVFKFLRYIWTGYCQVCFTSYAWPLLYQNLSSLW